MKYFVEKHKLASATEDRRVVKESSSGSKDAGAKIIIPLKACQMASRGLWPVDVPMLKSKEAKEKIIDTNDVQVYQTQITSLETDLKAIHQKYNHLNDEYQVMLLTKDESEDEDWGDDTPVNTPIKNQNNNYKNEELQK